MRNNGQLLSVKAIAYLVLAIISIIAAFSLLIRVYDSFIGGSAEKQDTQLLADVINRLIQDERPYIQEPFLFRLETDRIVGFSGDEVVRISTQEQGSSGGYGGAPQLTVQTEYNRGDCGTGACICTTNDETGRAGAVETCYLIRKPGDGKSVELRTNYHPYENTLQSMPVDAFSSVIPTNMPDIQKGKYTQFVIDRNNIQILSVLGKRTSTKSTNAIIPLLVEKISDQNGNVLITVLPDSDHMRARQAYLYQCPEKSAGNCGTPQRNTFVSSQNAEQTTACSVNPSTGLCSRNAIPPCSFDRLVTGPCRCGSKVALYGICVAPDDIRNLRCDIITSCDQYCTQSGGQTCSDTEAATFCVKDPCRVARSGTMCRPLADGTIGGIGGKGELGTPTITDVTKSCEAVPRPSS